MAPKFLLGGPAGPPPEHVFIESASRSPPGQVLKKLHFLTIFLISWSPSVTLFGAIFSFVALWDDFGQYSVLKNALGHQLFPKGRPRDVSEQ